MLQESLIAMMKQKWYNDMIINSRVSKFDVEGVFFVWARKIEAMERLPGKEQLRRK